MPSAFISRFHAGQPNGVFDSGVGGLAILGAVRKALPQEDLVDVAETPRRLPAAGADTIVRGRTYHAIVV